MRQFFSPWTMTETPCRTILVQVKMNADISKNIFENYSKPKKKPKKIDVIQTKLDSYA